jgi:hypothetical protein
MVKNEAAIQAIVDCCAQNVAQLIRGFCKATVYWVGCGRVQTRCSSLLRNSLQEVERRWALRDGKDKVKRCPRCFLPSFLSQTCPALFQNAVSDALNLQFCRFEGSGAHTDHSSVCVETVAQAPGFLSATRGSAARSHRISHKLFAKQSARGNKGKRCGLARSSLLSSSLLFIPVP